MSTSYSPIDEPSFTDTAFDAEEMLNGHRSDRHDTTPQPDDAPAASPYDESPYAGNNRQTASATPSRQTTYAPRAISPAMAPRQEPPLSRSRQPSAVAVRAPEWQKRCN